MTFVTFGHRLRAAGVSFEDRQDLLGHKSERMTTHYSAPDIARLIDAAETVCARRPNIVLRVAPQGEMARPTRFELVTPAFGEQLVNCK